MAAPKVFRHQNYDLICSAGVSDSGGFIPSLIVSKQAWPTRPRVIAVPRGHHLSEESAIEAARCQGIEWVANYG